MIVRSMKGIIFDMDGTMIDNMMIHHRIWQKTLLELGMDLTIEEVKATVHGVNVEILERLFGERFSPEERKQISSDKEASYRSYFKSRLKLLNGLPDLLETLYKLNVPMAVGTAAPAENTDFVLDNLKLRKYFRTVLHAGDVQNGKPHPEIFLKAAQGLGLSPSECLVFEDSVTGAATAANAGCEVIIVTTTHQPEEFAHFNHIIRFIKDFKEISIEDLPLIKLPVN